MNVLKYKIILMFLFMLKKNMLNDVTMRIITFYVQIHGITFAIALTIASDACIKSASCTTNILQYQTLVRHDDALGHIIV